MIVSVILAKVVISKWITSNNKSRKCYSKRNCLTSNSYSSQIFPSIQYLLPKPTAHVDYNCNRICLSIGDMIVQIHGLVENDIIHSTQITS